MAFFPGTQPQTAQSPQISTTFSFTPTSVTNGTFSVQTATVTGLDPIAHQFARVGQLVKSSSLGTYGQTANIIVIGAYVSAANTISVVFYNADAAPATPAAGFYSLVIF